MKAIVTHLTGFHYMKFQPGDGTLYTVLFGNMARVPDNMYIAIGSGDHIKGGYFFRRSSVEELAYDMIEWMDKDGRPLTQFVSEYPYFDYQHGKINIHNQGSGGNWTSVVAVLFALVYALGDITNDTHLNFIGDVYLNRQENVLEFFEEIGLITGPCGS